MPIGMRPTAPPTISCDRVDLPDHLQAVIAQGQHRRRLGYRGRFAPTPSGPLHRGNLRTALLSWLAARLEGGVWLLRIDDLDTPRVRPGAVESALENLRWLGLDWDGPLILQSRRRGLYHSVLSHLRRWGGLYACRCSRRELAAQPLYPGTCRNRALHWGWQNGQLPAWRLHVSPPLASRCGDLVLRRADGFIAYHLATAVDELALGISDVVRGEDLATVRDAQVAVIAALSSAAPPSYRHGPLLCDASGQKLSKRDGSQGLPPPHQRQRSAGQELGQLAVELGLVPTGSTLSAAELLEELRPKPEALQHLLLH